MRPFIAAANRGEDVASMVDAIARSFGFDGFLYGVSLIPRPNAESHAYYYSTWGVALSQTYSERSLIEVDPRIEDLQNSVLPIVWDQNTYRDRSTAVDECLDILAQHGISSGVVIPVRDMHHRTAFLSLSSGVALNDEVREALIADTEGDIMLFAYYFHELYVNAVRSEALPSILYGQSLSTRERECLGMAARGLSGEDIAVKLSITVRTTQHHFDSLRSKLGAANRLEAVAIGLEMGIISR
jgi:DNA-binding CsgD family transcriptional regulator